METPALGSGTVQADFRLSVVEANNVPAWCRTVAVSWKKGIKSVSTDAAPVQRGRAEWSSILEVSTTLCRSDRGASAGQVQTKLMWLQLSCDETSLGHAQIDLSRHCDGQAHVLNLQIVKGNHPSALLRTTLKISIQATRGVLSPVEAASVASLVHFRLAPSLSPSRRPHRPSSSSDRSSAQPLLAALSGDVSPEGAAAEQRPRTFSLGMSPSHRPAPSDVARERSRSKNSTMFGSPLHSHLPGPEPVPEAYSSVASSFKDLAPRLVSLCNRQCRQSGLTSVEQEDALEQLSASLRRAREPLRSCGIVFTAVPLHGRREPIEATAEGTVQPAVQEPLHLPPSLYSTPHFKASSEEENSRSGAARPLHDLLDRLAHIRALAMALPLPVSEGPAPSSPATGTPEEEDPLASHTIRGNFSHISATVAAASAAAASTAHESRPMLPIPSHHTRPERTERAERTGQERDANDLGEVLPTVLPDPAKPFEADPSDAAFGTNIEAAAATATAIATAVMMSQMIVQDIDDASNLCQEARTVVGSLISQLQGVARDRELWIHRYLAHRELLYSNTLCERALTERIDEGTNSAPVTAYG